MILIFGQECDPHIQAVIAKLRKPHFLFDIETCHKKGIAATFKFNNTATQNFFNHELCYSAKQISSIWWRIKPPLIQPTETLEYLRIQNLKDREWKHFLLPLSDLLHVPWINDLNAHYQASFKVRQLQKALDLGFAIPKTIISNNYHEIRNFVSKAKSQVIYKPLTYYYEIPHKITGTTIITEELLKKQSCFMVTPGIYQERIQKDLELRITVVGSKIFSTSIDTKQVIEAQLDWREYTNKIDFRVYPLPLDFENKLLDYHKSLGLVYGAYDFIVTPDHLFVFLEVNPAGQYLWLEEKLGLPISEAIAKELCRVD